MNQQQKPTNDKGRVRTEDGSNSAIPALGDACFVCVGQCLVVVDSLPESVYRQRGAYNSSIGTHMRHIIDRIVCVLDGIEPGIIDYDHRARESELETRPARAREVLVAIGVRLRGLDDSPGIILSVRESVNQDQPPVSVNSCLERELMSLVTHTIHHLAIIVLLARNKGHRLDPEIGKAPSTIVYERQKPHAAKAV